MHLRGLALERTEVKRELDVIDGFPRRTTSVLLLKRRLRSFADRQQPRSQRRVSKSHLAQKSATSFSPRFFLFLTALLFILPSVSSPYSSFYFFSSPRFFDPRSFEARTPRAICEDSKEKARSLALLLVTQSRFQLRFHPPSSRVEFHPADRRGDRAKRVLFPPLTTFAARSRSEGSKERSMDAFLASLDLSYLTLIVRQT